MTVPPDKLDGQVAIVTAASKGLGRASAISLARRGCRVCISARSRPALDEARRAIVAATGRPDDVIAMTADAMSQDDLDRVYGAVMSRWGKCDILIANCGGPKPGNYQSLKPDDYLEATKRTLMSFVRACYTVTPDMIRRQRGSIVTIQSFTIKQGSPNLILSNSIRLAVVGMVRSMATELGPLGIRVNSINPGLHATDRLMNNLKASAERAGVPLDKVKAGAVRNTPLGRINSAENFGENVAWLASDAAGYITGQAIIVDGGAAKSSL